VVSAAAEYDALANGGRPLRSDNDIEQDVKDELQWQPGLDSTDVAVSVKDGVVALTGFVRRYSSKQDAEVAAKRVAGVVGVANDIEVRVPNVDERPDPEIAREAVAAIRSRLPTSWEHIKAVVKKGCINLEGEVEWQCQRLAAEEAVRGLMGAKGISNMIRIKPRAKPAELGRRIEEAIKRNAELNANRISVEASGDEVLLKGTARSWHELEEAERVAWAAPGVATVKNRIVVRDDCGDNDLGYLWTGNRDCYAESAEET
jgi:osmotically-inducible protein OsmY